MPSVRGPQRLLVATILILSGTASGALVGLLTAMIAAPLPDLSFPATGQLTPGNLITVAVVGLGVALDATRLMVGRPAPPTSGRQVPQEWGRLLSPPVVAMLYGARLGVGPLTILSTWTWWSVTIAAALVGPLTAIAVGTTFGAVRLVVTVAASVHATRRSDTASATHADWFGTLRSRQRPNWLAINGLGFLAVAAFAVAGCSGADEDQATSTTEQDTVITNPTSTTWASTSSTTTPDIVTTTMAVPAIHSANLEDFVRTVTTPDTPTPPVTNEDGIIIESAPSQAATASNISSSPEDLADSLTATITGFTPVNDPMADRYLDITAASQLQPDPTEEIALLETRGFKGGWTRAFRNDTNDVAVASVYQFEDAAEAEFYLEDGLITIGGYGGKFFDVEGLPGVRGFVQYFSETDEDGTEELVSLGAAFQSGPRWYLVYFVGSAETVTPEVLIPAVATQRQQA